MAMILWAAISSSTKLVRLVKVEVVVEQDREAVPVGGALAVDAAVVEGAVGVAVAGIGTAVIEVAEEIVAGSMQDNRIVLSNREPALKGSLFCLTQRTRSTFPVCFAQHRLAPSKIHPEPKELVPGYCKNCG